MSTNQLRPKYPSGIEANELSKFDKGIETDGILNTGLIEHGPDAKMTVPEDNTTTAAEIGGIRYNPDTDEFEGGFGDQSWRQLGGGGIRWVQADKNSPLHIAQTARGYLIDNRLMQSQIILPVVDRVGTIIAVADQFGQFAIRPLTIKASGRKIYGQTDDMTISTNNVSATFTWSGDEQGWIITSGIGLGQGQVYNRTIFSEVLIAPTAFINVNHATEMVDVYINGARLAENRYDLADTGVALKEELPSGVEVQVIEYKPIQLTISDEDSRLKALEQQVQALKDGPIIWRYTATGGETVLNPGTAFTRCKLEINGIGWDIDDFTISDNKIILPEPLAIDPVSGQGDRVKVTIGFDNEVGFEGYVSKQELKDEDGAKMVGTSLVSNLDDVISGKVLQWTAGAKVTSPHQIIQYADKSYQYIGYLPHVVSGANPTSDGGVWSVANPAGVWVAVGDLGFAATIGSAGGAAMVGMKNGGNLQQAIGWVTPEQFGAKGDGIVDDINAINAAVATGMNVIFNSSSTYLISSSIILPYTATWQNLFGNDAVIKAKSHFLMFQQKLFDGTVSMNTAYKNFYGIRGVGTAHAKSIYTQVVQSQFLRMTNGTATDCSAVGFCNGLSLMGGARVFNFYADDIRNAAIRGEGENNFLVGMNAGFIAGDVVLIKSNYSYYSNLFCEYAGVSPEDTEEPASLRDQGAMVSFAQDGQNAIGNVVDTCHCLNYGGAFAVFSGSYNKMTGSLYGGAFVEARRAKGAGNAIYMAGTYNMIADVQLDLVYSGIEMHTGSSHCSIGYITIEAKSGYGTYAISINGTTKDCHIRGLHVKRGLTKSADAYLGTDGTNIGELKLENFTQPSSGASPVRVLGSNIIDRLYVSQSSTSTSTFINVTIQGNAQIRDLQIDGCLGNSLLVTAGAVPNLGTVQLTPNPNSTVPPCIFAGTDTRVVGGLIIRGGSAVGQPRANGTLWLGSYRGPSWARSDSAVAGTVHYPDPVAHNL
ncbi:virion structural protein [Serratia phage vB_SmaA_3M]|uniref:Putative tail spike protein n=1 Tax=Serratia phage vB_SmaA_3M TaxID=2419930 RepID=A0A3G2YS27_9CAUD|nr:virion structural protein [Serratia phage vB_SmaA_3M]AYP28289.1 putative tail spike protein [Serratia phage vB_SmaA_3M]